MNTLTPDLYAEGHSLVDLLGAFLDSGGSAIGEKEGRGWGDRNEEGKGIGIGMGKGIGMGI